MKRKLMYNDSASIYAAPALESTLLLETGGLDDPNQIGNLPSTNISAAVSAGTRTFQYNRFFWNKELFSFNYSNNSIGVAVAYYRALHQTYCFAIYPIFLPRVAMTLLQSITSGSVSDDPVARAALLKHLVYYLNMGFTSYGVGNNYGIQNKGVGFQMAPWVTAFDCKGSPYSHGSGSLIVNNGDFPIFQDGVNIPPLYWTTTGNNSQLALVINPNYESFSAGDRIGFQIITLEPYMANAPFVSAPGTPTGYVSSNLYYQSGFNKYPASSYGDGTGWCCQGAFATGFGQSSSYTSFENAAESPTTYTDIYAPTERLDLWKATIFPQKTATNITLSDFTALCEKFKLSHNCGGSSGIVVSRFITSMIPARFFVIESDALTRNQKRPVSSNNPVLAGSTMAIQFLTLDNLRTWEDNTVAGLTSSAGSILFGSRKSGVDDCSIVALDPMQSLQTIDLILRDEWGNVIQNYAQLQSMTQSNTYDMMGYFDTFATTPLSFTVAPWVTTNFLPPDIGANGESILYNESWWCSAFQFFGFNPAALTQTAFPNGFQPAAPRSTTFSHFGRVLGY